MKAKRCCVCLMFRDSRVAIDSALSSQSEIETSFISLLALGVALGEHAPASEVAGVLCEKHAAVFTAHHEELHADVAGAFVGGSLKKRKPPLLLIRGGKK